MKKTSFLVLFLISLLAFSQQKNQPKVVVGIVVDQMRQEYLYRYYNDFGEGGFKRLMKEGFLFKNTHFNYMPTYTAPGHSSIYTGTTPSVHGIVGNSWYNRGEEAEVYCTTDPSVQCVGMTDPNSKEGQMSPVRLKATTITDEVKQSTNFRGKVIGISIKDRGAVLPAGHFADAAYWINDNGDFISSTFYMDQLPEWVKKFNEKKLAEKYIKQGWQLLKPIAEYDESLPDDNEYERVFKPVKDKPTFPYDLQAIAKDEGDNGIIKTTPFGNEMVAQMAIEALNNEKLGEDAFLDFLAVSFSSTDYVGHSFGPRSVEVQDTYLRLDQTLAKFLTTLDQKFGKGNYLLFLTADHAVAENPKYLFDRGYYVQNLKRKENAKFIKDLVDAKFGEGIFVEYSNQNVFLNEKKIQENKLEYDQILFEIKNALEQKPFVSRVYSRSDILKGNPNDYHLSLIARGYDPKQNGDLVVLFTPQYMESYDTGSTHGSTYMYDTHVPNIWFGWNVKPGESNKRYTITNIAPTVSLMLNIPIPNGSEGYGLEELLGE